MTVRIFKKITVKYLNFQKNILMARFTRESCPTTPVALGTRVELRR